MLWKEKRDDLFKAMLSGGETVTLLKLKSKEEAILIARALLIYNTPEANELFIKICDRLDMKPEEVEDV